MDDDDADDEWADWTDAQLKAFEERLYDREVDGEDCWFLRDQVLNEMNRRGLCDRSTTTRAT